MAARECQAEIDANTKFRYDFRARSLPSLPVGAPVRFQDPKTKLWSDSGVIVAIGKYRSYRIKLANGSVLRQNRRFLRLMVPTAVERGSSAAPIPSAAEDHVAAAETDVPENERLPMATPPETLRRSDRTRKPRVTFSI